MEAGDNSLGKWYIFLSDPIKTSSNQAYPSAVLFFFFLVYTLSTVVRIWFQVHSLFTFIFQAPGKLNNHKTGILITTLGNTLVFFFLFFLFFFFWGGVSIFPPYIKKNP